MLENVDLSVYSVRTLQEVTGFLQLMLDNNVTTVADALASLTDHITNSGVREIVDNSYQVNAMDESTNKYEICPSCNKGYMRICRVSSAQVGSNVFVCSSACGYSYTKIK